MERARQNEIGTAERQAQPSVGGPTGQGGSGGAGTLGGATGASPAASQGWTGAAGAAGTPGGGTHAVGGTHAGAGPAGAVAEEARGAVGEVVGEVQRQASSRLSEQIGRTSERLGGLSTALTSVGRELREQDDAMAGWVDRAAEQVEQLSGYLRGKDLDEIVEEAEGFARRQPALFLGGAFVLGLVAARFLKSAAPRNDGWHPGYGASGYGARPPRPYPGTRPSQPGYDAGRVGYAAGAQTGYGAPGRGPASTGAAPPRPAGAAGAASGPTGPTAAPGTRMGGAAAGGGTVGSGERTSGL
jgi:hypothetical protein